MSNINMTECCEKLLNEKTAKSAIRCIARAGRKDPVALALLSWAYWNGIGVAVDEVLAKRYERLARELEKRRVQCEKRYNRLRAQSLRDGCYRGAHFSSKRREALHIAAISNGHEMICEYFQGTKHGKRMAYGRAA